MQRAIEKRTHAKSNRKKKKKNTLIRKHNYHSFSNFAVTLWAAVKQVQKSAIETGVSFKDYGGPF